MEQDAANEVNAESMRFCARRIASAYAREHGRRPGLGAERIAATAGKGGTTACSKCKTCAWDGGPQTGF